MEVTKKLIYELAKAIELQLGDMEQDLLEMRGEVRALGCELGVVQLNVATLRESIGGMEGRLSRIERRFEIIDTPAIGS